LSPADSPCALARSCDVILIVLFDSASVHQVLFDKDGICLPESKGKLIIDITTNHPEFAKLAHQKLKELDIAYLEAPVLGSVKPALKGELTMLVSGSYEDFEKSRELTKLIAKKIIYVGDIGNASKLKLLNNLVLGSFMQAICEAVALGEALGFERQTVLEVLQNGAGKSYILDVKSDKLLSKDYSPHFSTELIEKDLSYLEEVIGKEGLFSLSLSSAKNAYRLGVSLGLAKEDFSSLAEIFHLIKSPRDT
ncbi:MAG: NAD(P)-dependent oxidoreductase, partial [Aquificaceae bacterium]|nr:NAD(P)-dependent oxidoreductase [Aquificaceae bacterium]MDW8237942.1 NAD(P)-dependent oxidoreductase [Aquificaceae bacterium]